MISEYTINNEKVLITDSKTPNLIIINKYDNIEEDFRLNNKLEILEGKEAYARGKLRRLKDKLNNLKIAKALSLIVSLGCLALITLIELIINHALMPVLINFLLTSLSLGTLNILFRVILAKYYLNPKEYQIKEDIINDEISYLSQEISKVKQQIYNLKRSKKEINKENITKSLVKYNEEQELLINAKLQLIGEYNKRKGEYIESFNKGNLKKLVNDPDEEILIRELILKDIKNNKN